MAKVGEPLCRNFHDVGVALTDILIEIADLECAQKSLSSIGIGQTSRSETLLYKEALLYVHVGVLASAKHHLTP